jgi:hypothetical protein
LRANEQQHKTVNKQYERDSSVQPEVWIAIVNHLIWPHSGDDHFITTVCHILPTAPLRLNHCSEKAYFAQWKKS